MKASDKLRTVLASVRLFFPLAMIAAFIMVVAFAGCDSSLLLPDGGGDNEDGLEVPITRLSFNRSRLASTLGSGETVRLGFGLQIFPPHHTMPLEGEDRVIEWDTDDNRIAVVDEYGNVTFVLTEEVWDSIGDGRIFAEATITARFKHNRSVFAEMPVIVLPDFGATREVNFNWGQHTGHHLDFPTPSWWVGPPAVIPQQVGTGTTPNVVNIMDGNRFSTVNMEGDRDLGDGIILRTGTGALNNEEMARGTTALGLDTARDDPNPWLHSVAFLIDPENPYENSPQPTGDPVSWGSLHNDANPLNLNDPRIGDPTVNAFTHHLRTGGNGWRLFEILGLQRPFEIEVVYTTNDAGSGRAAGIRFGNDFWVEGPLGFETANSPPDPNPQLPPLRVVRFEYRDFVYSYGAGGVREWVLANGARVPQIGFVEDSYNPRVPLEDFQPSVFVDVSAPTGPGGLRIYSLRVRQLLDAAGNPDWGERPPN